MAIYLIRHPETDWNVKGLLQGQQEGKVTKKGFENSRKFIKKSLNYNFELIYTANNQRTKILAEMLSKTHKSSKIIVDNRLNERSFGDYEGMESKEVGKKNNYDPKNFKRRYTWRPPNGESLKDISERVSQFIFELRSADVNGSDILAVTSGGVIKTALYIEKIRSLEDSMTKKVHNLEMFEI